MNVCINSIRFKLNHYNHYTIYYTEIPFKYSLIKLYDIILQQY